MRADVIASTNAWKAGIHEARLRERVVIARIWRGAVRPADADAYGSYIAQTGLAGYVQTAGNRGAWMLRRDVGELTEYVTFTLWDSLDAVKAFAGADYETAVFYPEDDRFLVERDEKCAHYDVVAG
jgi:heme-degrading monooxygenase HmoA